MGYLPKSKYKKLFTSGEEFVEAETKLMYRGPYIQTPTGYYAGHNASKLNKLLAKIHWKDDETDEIDGTGKMLYSHNAVVYQRISQKDKFIRSTQRIIATKNKPTKKDYKKGRYIRYFAKKNNSPIHYIEVSEKTYKAIVSRNRKYDHYLYTAGKIDWSLEGNVVETNRNLLLLKSRDFPNISLLFPKLNEFQKLLYTNGNEMTYLDGRKYRGYYHIHDGVPMEGAHHKSTPHAKLKWNKNSILTKEAKETLYIPPKQIQDKISSTQKGTSGDISPAGGGGY